MKSNIETIVALGALAATIGIAIVAALSEGFVLVKMNEWFIMPTFGTPSFGYWTAAGLAMTFSLISHHNDAGTEVEGTDAFKRLSRPLVRPWIVLGFGYAFYCWSAA